VVDGAREKASATMNTADREAPPAVAREASEKASATKHEKMRDQAASRLS
jgi:hypothetical protein